MSRKDTIKTNTSTASSWRDTVKEEMPSSTSDDWRSTIQEQQDTEKGGWLATATFSEQELDQIAKEKGVDPAALKEKAGWVGAKREQQTAGEVGKRAAEFGSSVLLGVPTKLFITSESDPQMQAALDKVREIAEEKKSTAQSGAELAAGFLVPMSGIAKGAATTGKLALEGAAFGALSGYGYSKTGEELGSAATNAGLGAAFAPAASKAIGAIRSRLGKKAGEEVVAKEATVSATIPPQKESAIPQLEDLVAQSKEKYLTQLETVSNPTTLPKGDPAFSEFAKSAEIPTKRLREVLKDPESEESKLIIQKFAEWKDSKPTILDKELKKDMVDAGINFKEPLAPESPNALRWQRHLEGKGIEKEAMPSPEKNVLQKTVEAIQTRLGEGRTVVERIDRATAGRVNATGALDSLSKGIAQGERALTKVLTPHLERLSNLSNKMVNDHFQGSEDAFAGWMRTNKYNQTVQKQFENNPAFLQDLAAYGKEMNELRKTQGNLAADLFDIKDPVKREAFIRDFIPENKNPFHETVSDSVTIVRRLQDRLNRAFGAEEGKGLVPDWLATGKLPDNLKVVDESALQELKEVVQFLKGGSQLPENLEQTDWNAIKGLFNINKLENATANIRNTAALRATGKIPTILLETNPERQLLHLANVVNKATYLQKPVIEMEAASKKLLALGRKEDSDYLADIIKDIQGGRVDSFSTRMQDLAQQHKADLLRAADRTENPIKKNLYSLMAEAPDLMSFFLRQAYPNFLGMSVRANIMNSTQALVLTLPELARGNPADWTRLLVGGLKMAAKDLNASWQQKKIRTPAHLIQYAEGLGLTKGERPEALKKLMRSEMVKHSKTLQLTGDMVDKATGFAMKFFEFSEAFNRTLTRGIANHIVESGQAAKYAHILPPGYRKELNRLTSQVSSDPKAAAATQEAIAGIFESQLMGSTMFNYDKATASKFVREMGPVFGMFTKWPTAIAGKMANQYLEGGAWGLSKHLGTVYLAPLGALAGLQTAIDSGLDTDPESLRRQAFLGKDGLTAAAPIQSAKGLVSGEMFSPPAYSTAKQVATGIVGAATSDAPEEEVPKAAFKAAVDTYRAFGPMGWIVRLMTKDVPKMLDISPDLAKPE